MNSSETKVVFLGPKFTFSHEAALKMFPRARYFYEISPKEIFKKVDSGEMDYGILPVENSATGIIHEFYPLLVDQAYLVSDDQRVHADVRVHVVKELYLPIYHHLLVRTQMPLHEIQTLYANRQPYLQCVDWIQHNLPNAKFEPTDSTAAAAEKLAQDSRGACIGGNLLAKHEGLTKLRENIQDYVKNVTRFFAVSAKHTRIPRNSNKTTFAIIIPDHVGTLVSALQVISDVGISLTTIKTLSIRAAHVFSEDFRDWFIVDVKTGSRTPAYRDLELQFRKKKSLVLSYKFLGSYFSSISRGEGLGSEGAAEVNLVPKNPSEKRAFYEDLIKGGESENVEFKASLHFDYRTKTLNRELTKVVLRGLCGFMNSNGGYLFIGISDNGEILGIDADINILKKKSVDGFLTAFYQGITDLLGKEYSHYVHPEIMEYNGRKICCIKVDSSSRAVWMGENNLPTFYVRTGNSTRPYNAKEANEYVLSRFAGR